jgi:hypothetical protein
MRFAEIIFFRSSINKLQNGRWTYATGQKGPVKVVVLI